MIEGVDYSWGRPGGAALVAAGKRFALRYCPYPGDGGKGLSATELAELHACGLSVGIVFESTAGRAKVGAAAGIADATTAKNAMGALGFPSDRPCYFAVDFDMRPNDEGAVAAYLGGAAKVLGVARVGIYGGLAAVSHAQSGKWASWFWQTYAWSLGHWAPGVHLQQYANGQTVNGAAVDYDRALVEDWGGWKAKELAMPYSAPSHTDNTTLVDCAGGGTVYWDLESHQVAIAKWVGSPNVTSLGTAKRADGMVLRCIVIQTTAGGPLYTAWYGDNKCSNVRLKDPPPVPPTQTVTVTGQGIKVEGYVPEVS
jgi:hypothetical protein